MSITSSNQAYFIFPECVRAEVEEVWAVALNSRLQIISKQMLFRGSVSFCATHPRDIFRFLCLNNATSFIIAHNHPSGDPRPSKHDRQTTRRLREIAELIEIPMNDHLILGKNSYYSFSEKRLIKIYCA
jgi:DNA repair protein RadC